MKRFYLYILLGVYCVFLLSCTTTNKKADSNKMIVMHGLVCNRDNEGVEGYHIFSDDSIGAVTDEKGYFELCFFGGFNVNIHGEKDGWESIDAIEENVDETKLYVYRIDDYDALFSMVESAIKYGDYYEADNLLTGVENIEKNYRAMFYKSLISYKQNKFEDAMQYLNRSNLDYSGNSVLKTYYQNIDSGMRKKI